jgi:hypothetical protein
VPTLVGFGTFAALPEEQISEKISRRILSGDQGMIVWWSIGAGVHVEPHSHANEQIAWMLKGKMEFRLGSEQRVCGRGIVSTPWGAEKTSTAQAPSGSSRRDRSRMAGRIGDPTFWPTAQTRRHLELWLQFKRLWQRLFRGATDFN